MGVILLIIGIILFIGLVVVHELGHFWVARRNGVDAEEFGIFFPPRIWSRKIKGKNGKKGFEFSINALPLGGFVRLKGEHDSDTGTGTFGAASLLTKTKIMLAGVGMNLLAALVLFTILAWIGIPQLVDNQFTVKSDTKVSQRQILIDGVLPNSPAAHIGLQFQDKLVSIGMPNQKPVRFTGMNDFQTTIKRFAGQKVAVSYVHDGTPHTATVTLLSKQVVAASQHTAKPKAYLGVAVISYVLQRSTWSAPVVALGLVKQFTVLTFKGLGAALKGLGSTIAGFATHNKTARQSGQTQASDQVTGPVGIFVILKDGSALGYQFMLMIIAVISLTLAIMNILPIPALDGGKLFLTLAARLFRKRLTQSFEEWVYGSSFILLLGLMVLITIVDVKRH
ncbi:MAG TPA: M50 family metallopeptidase [Candidatus Saccharimonadales bacterium]|jgi:regulator of sigma E protease